MTDPHVSTSSDPDAILQCPQTIDDVELFAPGAQAHWYPAYELLHRHDPVRCIPSEGFGPGSDGYILSKHEDIARVVRDPERFPPTLFLALEKMAESSSNDAAPGFVNAMMVSMQSLRPTHALWRAHRQELTDPWVGPGAGRHEGMIREVANQLVDALFERAQSGEPIDFVQEFARPLPQLVMANILGFPHSDLARLERWGNAQVAAFVYGRGHRNEMSATQLQEQAATLIEFQDYTASIIAARRAEPSDDMISYLTTVHYTALDRTLTDIEINGIVYAMVIGGLETTQYAMSEQALLLCQQSHLWQRLSDERGLLRGFTEEAMRLRSPTQGLSTRVTTQEEVFQNTTVPAGSLLHLRWAAANVDPSEWQCPFDLDLQRKAVTRHLVFSQGPRVCPGAQLSRLEQQVAWGVLLDRFAAIRQVPGHNPKHQPGIMLGMRELRVYLDTTPNPVTPPNSQTGV